MKRISSEKEPGRRRQAQSPVGAEDSSKESVGPFEFLGPM